MNYTSKRVLVSAGQNMHIFGGAQLVLSRLHHSLKPYFQGAYVIDSTDFTQVNETYGISDNEYRRLTFKNLLSMRGAVVLSHYRKMTSMLELVNKLFGLNMIVIHIAHNEFDNLNLVTFFPRHVVAVSEGVRKNLVNYFGLPSKQIRVIYNGVPVVSSRGHVSFCKPIRVLHLGRVCKVKQQLSIFVNLRGSLHEDVEIHFAGVGEDYQDLLRETADSEQFKALGFVKDVAALMANYHFILLYSTHEGFPISLLEAQAAGKPAVVNNVGGNLEIISDGHNGYVANEWTQLITTLNSLRDLSEEQYKKLCGNSLTNYHENFALEMMVDSYVRYLFECVGV